MPLISLPAEIHLEIASHLSNDDWKTYFTALKPHHNLGPTPQLLKSTFWVTERDYPGELVWGNLFPCYGCLEIKNAACFWLFEREFDMTLGSDCCYLRRCYDCRPINIFGVPLFRDFEREKLVRRAMVEGHW